MLYALATPGSAFKPSIKKLKHLEIAKIQKLYIQKVVIYQVVQLIVQSILMTVYRVHLQ